MAGLGTRFGLDPAVRSTRTVRGSLALVVAGMTTCAAPHADAQTPAPPYQERAAGSQEQTERQLKLRDERLLKKYVWSTLGPAGAMQSALLAASDQWRHRPEQWSLDGSGYFHRFASNYAASAIGGTTKYTIAHLFKQDPSFERCHCHGTVRRLGHAMSSPFMARGADGRRVFSMATVGGIAAENVVPAVTWYPPAPNAAQGLYRASVGIATKAAVDVVREFMPEHQKP
jgi:hypothetical protein